MIEDNKVTIIHEDGMIIKENPILLEGKTVIQILQYYHPTDFSNYILGIRTPTIVEILRPYSIPLSRHPLLKTSNSNEDFTIPNLSLCILNASEKEKALFVLHPIDESLKDIRFPPFIYGFNKKDLSKAISTMKNEITQYFGLPITNTQLFLDEKEVSNCNCQKFIDDVTKNAHLNKIWFKFNLSQKGKEKLEKRQKFVNELTEVIMKFCSDIIQFHNQVGKKVQETKIFTDFEYNTIFGSIIDMFKVSTRFTTALTGNDSYDSYLGNIIFKFIPELEDNFKEFIANYRTDKLIPDIIKKYKNNPMLEEIVHQTFGKSAISFESMAILPIQILPRYKLLFDNILKTTPKSHPEYSLFLKNISRIDKTIMNLENYNSVRDVTYLQNRLISSYDKNKDPLDIKGRYMVSKYNVNIGLISRGTLYLLNDLIILTRGGFTHEYEIFRFKYDEFIFFPNLASSLIVYHNRDNRFDVMRFQSVKIMKEMINKLIACRQKALDANPNKSNALIAYENIFDNNQSIPPMIDSSCYKISSLVVAASSGVYFTYELHNKSLYFFKKVKNIHPYAKLVGVQNSPYIYGGDKFPCPFEFSYDQFTELVPQNLGFYQPEFGKIFHTCCSFKNFIVIFGGYTPKKKNRRSFSSDVYFFNVKTYEWIASKSGFEAVPEARYKHSAVIYKNIMIIHGGLSCKDNRVLDDTWFYNFNDGKWSIFEFGSNNNIIIPRFGHSSVMVNHFMFIIGGLTNPKQSSNEQIQNDSEINIENTISTSETLSTATNSENTNSNEEESINNYLSTNNSYVPAPSCFCLDIENCRLFSVNIIGNFLPGLSLFTSVYDNFNQQIILIGGQYQNNKEEKYTSIFTKLSIPQIYTQSPIPNDEDIKSIGRRIHRNMSASLFRTNDVQVMRKEETKCSSLNQQNPFANNRLRETRISPSPSTPYPKKIVIPKIFLS